MIESTLGEQFQFVIELLLTNLFRVSGNVFAYVARFWDYTDFVRLGAELGRQWGTIKHIGWTLQTLLPAIELLPDILFALAWVLVVEIAMLVMHFAFAKFAHK